jgi:flagellar biosynthesis component FlhA
VSTGQEMIILLLISVSQWLFTLGLALSTAVDILITSSLFLLLKTARTTDFKSVPFLILHRCRLT